MQLTQESIHAARQWFAQNALACIAEVKSGAVQVNHPEDHVTWLTQQHDDVLAGKYDHVPALRQHALHIQTGKGS